MIFISKANQSKFITGSLTVSTIKTNPSLGLDNGVIVVVVSGGTAPYRYVIDRSEPQASNQFNGLEAKNYVIQVVDKFGKIGWEGVALFDNVDCGDYAGTTVQDIINTGLKVGNFFDCTVDSFY